MENLFTQYGPMIATFVLGIGGVAAFLAKVMPTVKKYLALAADTIVMLRNVETAIADDKLTEQEWEGLRADIARLRISWTAVWAKK